jgi:hypothetical protein
MKQTAVEFLWDMLSKGEFINDPEELFNQAKEMEKNQIKDAYNISWVLRDKPYATADKYYNETFKSK